MKAEEQTEVTNLRVNKNSKNNEESRTNRKFKTLITLDDTLEEEEECKSSLK